jgi:hypothetical protein
MTIADKTKDFFHTQALKDLVDFQVERGIAKYGQTLDDNQKEPAQKAIHALQEIVDAMQYMNWLGDERTQLVNAYLAATAEYLYGKYCEGLDLTHKEGYQE